MPQRVGGSGPRGGGGGGIVGSFFGSTPIEGPIGFNRPRDRASPVPSLQEIASAHHEPGTGVILGTGAVNFDVTAAGAGVELAKLVLTRGLYELSWYASTNDITTALRRIDVQVMTRAGQLYAFQNGIVSANNVAQIFQGSMRVWVHEERIEGTGSIPNRPAFRLLNVEASAAAKITIGNLTAVRLWTDLTDPRK